MDVLNGSTKSAVVRICRKIHFCAAHRLHSIHLSDQENKKVYGKCNHANGHGHNYEVEVELKGKVDKLTGMVYNLSDLEGVLQIAVMGPCDHKNLDKDISFFKDHPSTTENVAIFLWNNIKECLHPDHLLHQITIHETPNNTVVYRGEEEEEEEKKE